MYIEPKRDWRLAQYSPEINISFIIEYWRVRIIEVQWCGHQIQTRFSERIIPYNVVVSSYVIASGFRIELVRAAVFLYSVSCRTFLDVHTLITVGGDSVAPNYVAYAIVGRIIHPLQQRTGTIGRTNGTMIMKHLPKGKPREYAGRIMNERI